MNVPRMIPPTHIIVDILSEKIMISCFLYYVVL
nr:MAG TPA: hypothetical protein [Caudoviricetes sp.]